MWTSQLIFSIFLSARHAQQSASEDEDYQNISSLEFSWFKIRERVRFTYTGVDCVTSFSETTFALTEDNNEHSDLNLSILKDYQELMKYLSVLNFLTEEETETEPQHTLTVLRQMLYDALCSMNKALRRLGHQGEMVSRQIYIAQTTDMCEPTSISEGYVRNLELLRLLERLSRNMFNRFYAREHNLL